LIRDALDTKDNAKGSAIEKPSITGSLVDRSHDEDEVKLVLWVVGILLGGSMILGFLDVL